MLSKVLNLYNNCGGLKVTQAKKSDEQSQKKLYKLGEKNSAWNENNSLDNNFTDS